MVFNLGSLRYRITLTIFILEAVLLFVLLYSTSTHMKATIQKNTESHQDIIMKQVSVSATVALFAGEFDLLQQKVAVLAQTPEIEEICIYTRNSLIVSHSLFSKLGVIHNPKSASENHINREITLPELGGIQIVFNQKLQTQQIAEARNFGTRLAMIGLLITLTTSLFFGRVLTRKLDHLSTTATLFHNNPNQSLEPFNLKNTGHDEVDSLSNNFYTLMATLQYHMKQLNIDKERVENRVKERTAELEKTHRNLIKAKQVAEHALQVKSEFLAKMSHEVRTPLNAIVGLIDLCGPSQQTLPPKISHYLKHMQHSSLLLRDILNNILDFSKLESGKTDLELAPFDTQDLNHSLTFLFQNSALEKGLNFSVEISPDLPPVLVGDLLRIKQILMNLMSNAIKFTTHGAVSCRISHHPLDHTHITLHCVVEDSGMGISSAVLHSLFDSFQQGDNSISRQFGGTGLGLAIAQDLTQLMNGSLTAISQEGLGSQFTLQLPLGSPEETASTVLPTVESIVHGDILDSLQNKHILVAEDDPVNQLIAQTMLENMRIQVSLADNGQQAIDLIQQHSFDLILMDVQMPIMDGLEATRRIRQHHTPQQLPIVAMTAQAMTGDQEMCLQSGMNAYLSKPMHREDLFTMISSQLKITT
jgi:signal transduction histidine kinase/CheY-like chemotaxis protein